MLNFVTMQRFSAFVLMLWYAALSVGILLHTHSCCGSVAGLEMNGLELWDFQCCHDTGEHTCGSEKACCDDEEVYLALDEDHASAPFLVLSFFVELREAPQFFQVQVLERSKGDVATDAQRGPPKYIAFQQQLVYG